MTTSLLGILFLLIAGGIAIRGAVGSLTSSPRDFTAAVLVIIGAITSVVGLSSINTELRYYKKLESTLTEEALKHVPTKGKFEIRESIAISFTDSKAQEWSFVPGSLIIEENIVEHK